MSGSECHDSQSWGYRITEEMEIAVVSDYSDYHTKPWSRRHSPYAPFRGWGVGGLIAWLLLVAVVGLVYRQTLTPVTLIVDGRAMAMRTSQDTISALLVNAGVTLRPEDIVVPGDLNQALEPGGQVIVRHAQPVYVCTDGQEALFYTQATSWVDVLNEARVSVGPYDEVIVEGWLAAEASGVAPDDRRTPARITVRRATPFHVYEDDHSTTFYSTASTVGEALRQIGMTLYIADGVRPSLGEPLQAGMEVHIQRSRPVTVQVDGRTLRARTHREYVREVLADLGVVMTGQDYTRPPLDAPLTEDTTIQVVRVSEKFLVEQEPIPYETIWQPDPDLEIDNERVMQEGSRGVLERRIRVQLEDGQEVSRTVDGTYVLVPPTTKILGYGTKIVVRTIDTPSGPVEYWRKIRMLATSYSAGTSGTSPSSPWYGRTATGMQMRFGIVAVDPRVVQLHSQVYVPGYGIGLAGDTGGAIRGRRIDLGYDDDNLVLWYRWVDVYLLTPAPPPDQINYRLGK